MAKKKVLIVSPFFAPENSVASIRFTKIAKYLIRMGVDVSVIRTDMMRPVVKDAYLEKDREEIKNVYTVNYPDRFYASAEIADKKKNIGTALHDGKKLASKLYSVYRRLNIYYDLSYFLSLVLFEQPLAKRILQKVKELIRENGVYDAIITTYSPFCSVLVGKYAKKHHLCRKWIMDYRDLVEQHKEKCFMVERISAMAYKAHKYADYITAVSEAMLSEIIEKTDRFLHTDVYGRAVKITNGYDPEEAFSETDAASRKRQSQDMLTFVFAGSFYENGEYRNSPEPLLAALKALSDDGSMDLSKIEINYAGKMGDSFKKLARRYDMEGVIHDHGYIPRNKVYDIYAASDIFLVCIWNKDDAGSCLGKGVISGKFFESIAVKRNVLCISVGNADDCELGRMIRNSNIGFSYEEASSIYGMEALKKWIFDKYREKMQHGELEYSPRDTEQYSHSYLARRFFDLI